jgi:hypothetical protein
MNARLDAVTTMPTKMLVRYLIWLQSWPERSRKLTSAGRALCQVAMRKKITSVPKRCPQRPVQISGSRALGSVFRAGTAD